MDSNDSRLDEMYERLSAAIMQAITSSEDIKEILQDLGSQGLINESAVFNLFLSLEELDEYMNPKPDGDKIYKLEPSGETSRPKTVLEFGYANKENVQHIDGQKLSPREKMFEDFYRANFDEQGWLKKARIRL